MFARYLGDQIGGESHYVSLPVQILTLSVNSEFFFCTASGGAFFYLLIARISLSLSLINTLLYVYFSRTIG
ncbi:MAG: hypothetical protein ACRCYD_13135, partial [Plesiomonas sp.]